MKILFILLLAAMVASISTPALAGYSEGMSAFWRKDYSVALQEFRAAADAGDSDAQFMLGKMYAEGLGAIQNYIDAHKWLNLSASQGNRDARELRDRIAEKMTAGQLAQAQQFATEWLSSEKAPAPKKAVLSQTELARIQQILSDLGYAAGPPDGAIGEKTRTAIRRYQSDKGLPADGDPTATLMEHLENTYAAVREEKTKADQSPTAEASAEPDQAAGMVEKLRVLASEAERKDAAQDWVIEELWSIVRQFDWAWPKKIVEDSFADGDYTRNPSWSVSSGRFFAEKNAGLQTSVAAAAEAAKQETRSRDLPSAILGEILRQATGERATGTASEEKAEISLSREIPNAFAVRLLIRFYKETGRIEFGTYQGTNRSAGYRLAVNNGSRTGIELLRISPQGSSVVDLYPQTLNLADGKIHSLQWTRGKEGEMAVSLDDREILHSDDRRYKEPFDGFIMINKGGDYTIRKVEISGAAG